MRGSNGQDPRIERIEFCNDVTIAEPCGLPITAFKVHAMQFGGILGTILGIFAGTKFRVAVDLEAVRFVLDAVQVSLILALVLVLFSFGIRLFSEVEASSRFPPPILSTEKPTVAVLQIRRRPHYFATALLAAWTIAVAVAGAIL